MLRKQKWKRFFPTREKIGPVEKDQELQLDEPPEDVIKE
jgi:hypothetical protein